MARPYKFGFSEFTTWPWSYRQDIENYKKHGATVVEVCEFKLAHNDYAELLKELQKSGMSASSIQAKVHSVFEDSMSSKPKDPEDRIHDIKKSMKMTAPHVPKGTPFIVITGIPPEGNFRKAVDRSVEALKDLGDFAAEHGLSIAFEPLSPVNIHTDTAVWGLDQGLEVIERVNHPAVGICIDSWNVWQTPALDDVIAQCGKRIRVVQLSDWRQPRSTADRYTLGEGEIPLARMMRAIRKTGYEGPWVVEILSSLHLDGSLWKSDMEEVLRKNHEAFDRLWDQSEP
jgi:sugar phosphate isomerase/epimerase